MLSGPCSLFTAVLALLLTASSAAAQTLSLPELVRPGQRVEVRDESGREYRGRAEQVSTTELTLVSADGPVHLDADRIVQIQRPEDTLANGALVGLGVGAAAGLLAATAGSTDCSDAAFICFDGPRFVVASTLVGAGLGAAIGAGVDAMIRRDRLIYRRGVRGRAHLRTTVGRRAFGAALTIAW